MWLRRTLSEILRTTLKAFLFLFAGRAHTLLYSYRRQVVDWPTFGQIYSKYSVTVVHFHSTPNWGGLGLFFVHTCCPNHAVGTKSGAVGDPLPLFRSSMFNSSLSMLSSMFSAFLCVSLCSTKQDMNMVFGDFLLNDFSR